MSTALRLFLVILGLGAYAQILQAVLVREALVVFYGNEISLGAFYASWLFWIGIGSLCAVRLDRRRGGSTSSRPTVSAASITRRWSVKPKAALEWLLLVLPLVLALQVLALRTSRLALDVSASELVPLGELFLVLFLITTPSGLILGLSFPLACRALQDAARSSPTRLVSRLYIADALGALVGGLLFTLAMVRGLGLVQSLGVLTALIGLMAWSIRPRPARPGIWAPLLVLGGALLAFAPGSSYLETALERLRFATLQPGLTLIDAAATRYGHLAIARLGDQRSLVEDGQITESFPLPSETAADAALLQAESNGAKRILIIGGFASGLAAELLRYPIDRLDQVEQDPEAFRLVEPHLPPESRAALEDTRLRMIFADGRRFVRDLEPDTRYGLVVIFAQSPSNAAGNRFFTEDFYGQVGDHLDTEGVLCTRVSAASSYVGREVGGFAGSIYHTLKSRFAQLALVPGDPVTVCAAHADGPLTERPEVLTERYRSIPLDERRFPADGFRSLLQPDEVGYLRERLESVPAEIDRDSRPVTYYLSTLLWGKLSASGLVDWMQRLRTLGPWPYLLPALLLIGLWLVRAPMEGWRRETRLRQGASYALFVLGLATMAATLVLLLGIQAQVGVIFERIALLNGLLMTGLALGAGLGAWWAGRKQPAPGLILVLLSIGAGVPLLPLAIAALAGLHATLQETGYLLLALSVGLVAGAGFPLGVALAHPDIRSTPGSAGLILAADSFGGALGGLTTGALMVPLLGFQETTYVLAALTLTALVPLLHGLFAPDEIQSLSKRGFHSLPSPWPGLGWVLSFLVLVALGWHWLEQGAAPGPQVRFDEGRLAEIAGPGHFRLAEQPFIHYLGSREESSQETPETTAVASQAAAPEVRGFAGPLNLLMAVDRDGRLRGVRYIDSRETPSYIQDIQDWLAGLAGRDLTQGPLSLDQVDGMSGATLTSRAALETINRSAARVSEVSFGRATPALAQTASGMDSGFWATLTLLLVALPVYLSGCEWARLVLMTASLVILGIWLNTPVTEVDLINLLQGHAATPAENPQRWLLWGFIGLTALLFGQLWCGILCPFGVLQELLGRLGRWLGLRRYPDRRLDARLRSLKLLLLAAMLLAVLTTGDGTWAGFDPMQHIFGDRLAGWMWALTAVVLVGSVVYVRFWCRYLCPLGAFLALSNKLAVLQHLAPSRRLEHCDLGVKSTFDLDCIRCNRCLSGRDTRLHWGQGDREIRPQRASGTSGNRGI